MSDKKTIAVLRGGPSSEHEVSLKTGAGMLAHMDGERFVPRDILIRKDGVWTVDGQEYPVPQDALAGVDAVLIGLHGAYGEDGQVQALLDVLRMPYAGTGVAASQTGMSKALTHGAVADVLTAPVRVAPRRVVAPHVWDAQKEEIVDNIIEHIGFPCVVKPARGGSSVGVSIIRDASEDEMRAQMTKAIDELTVDNSDDDVIVEKFVSGREVTCAVVENLGGVAIQALPLVEVVLSADQAFFDYDAKYSGKTTEICPAEVEDAVAQKIKDAAITIHQTIGCRDYSRSDFIIGEDGEMIFLEVNTLPGMTPTSFVPQSLAAVGVSYADFVTHLITQALSRK